MLLVKKINKKIATVIGARPQFIKAAVVSREIARFKNLQEVIIHTGQHYDANMSDVFFRQMQIPEPSYNLSVNNLSHGAMTGRMIEKIEEVFLIEKPDIVLVYGDTNTTLAAALAAVKLHIKVAHVEAGMRSYNKQMPEEINRVLTDHVSSIFFCSTKQAMKNLVKEGFTSTKNKIIFTGDVMYDASIFFAPYMQMPAFNIPDKFVLSTIHREENTSDSSKLIEIISALNVLHKNIPVLMPVHPGTKKLLQQYGCEILFNLVEPAGYLQMIGLLKKCSLVITDSGGLQKEAYFFEKPCITIREQTEWIELIDSGANILAKTNKNDIIKKAKHMLKSKINFQPKLYGDGNAAFKIASFLSKV